MVYNGPSTGCLACRKRKVRCDKGRPQCNNCLKRKHACPGYGNIFDARHRDQTRSIIQRVDSKYANDGSDYSNTDKLIKSDASNGLAMIPGCQFRGPDSPLLSFNLSLDLETSAINFFFNSYGRALGDCRAVHSFMPDLAPLYRNAQSQSPIHAATVCVAMNFYMLFSKQGSDTKLARGFYLKALTGLQEGLAHTDSESLDELIMTVLALDFYDALNCMFYPGGIPASHHKKGALALLKHRGERNFDTELSRAMTSHVRTKICQWAIESEISLAPEIIDILSHPSLPAKTQNILDNLTIQIATLLARYRSLHTSARELLVGTMTDPDVESLLRDALDLDERLAQWELEAPPRWRPIILTSSEVGSSIRDAGIYNDRCAVYADLAICEVLNKYRCRRLLLLQFIQTLCLRSKNDLSADMFDTKSQLMQTLANGICESIPFCLGDAVKGWTSGTMPVIRYPSTWKNGSPFPHPSVDHPGQAVAQGGWLALGLLMRLLNLMEPVNEMVPFELSQVQAEWVKQQLIRVGNVYTFSVPGRS